MSDWNINSKFEGYSGVSIKVALGAKVFMAEGRIMVVMDVVAVAVLAACSYVLIFWVCS